MNLLSFSAYQRWNPWNLFYKFAVIFHSFQFNQLLQFISGSGNNIANHRSYRLHFLNSSFFFLRWINNVSFNLYLILLWIIFLENWSLICSCCVLSEKLIQKVLGLGFRTSKCCLRDSFVCLLAVARQKIIDILLSYAIFLAVVIFPSLLNCCPPTCFFDARVLLLILFAFDSRQLYTFWSSCLSANFVNFCFLISYNRQSFYRIPTYFLIPSLVLYRQTTRKHTLPHP